MHVSDVWSFQELFSVDDMEHAEGWRKLLCNKYFATVITLVCGYILTQIGYSNIWPLFGSANQLLSALVLITLCVFLRVTGRENRTLLVPLVVMLCVTFTALVERCIALVKAYNAGTAVFMVEGLQLIIAVLLMVLGVIIVVHSGKVLFSKSTASKTENDKRSEMNKPAALLMISSKSNYNPTIGAKKGVSRSRNETPFWYFLILLITTLLLYDANSSLLNLSHRE